MFTHSIYDVIVYSAGPAGVTIANEMKRIGRSVLLLNFYGFSGGSITESLSCLQRIEPGSFANATMTMYENLRRSRHGLLFENESAAVINPESLKTILQNSLELCGTEILFHIVPHYILQREDYIELSISGKEGSFQVRGKTIVDTSEEYELIKLLNNTRELAGIRYNMFLTGTKEESLNNIQIVSNKIKLNDGRLWVSIKPEIPHSEYFIENLSQISVNRIEDWIIDSGGRIQLLAPQTEKFYLMKDIPFSERLFHINSVLSRKYDHDEIFIKTSEIEKKIIELV